MSPFGLLHVWRADSRLVLDRVLLGLMGVLHIVVDGTFDLVFFCLAVIGHEQDV